MALMKLSALQRECDLSSDVCGQLPADSVVLFSIRGRVDPSIVQKYFHAALNARAEKELSLDDRVNLNEFCAVTGDDEPKQRFALVRSLQTKAFREDLNTACGELSVNAFRYGMDAIRVPRLVEEFGNAEGQTAILFTSTFLDANSYAAFAMIYSEAKGEICLLTQNFVTERAAADLEKRFSGLGPASEPGRRSADDKAQPLLAAHGPIASLASPIALADEALVFDSQRTGIKKTLQEISSRQGAPILFGHQEADLGILKNGSLDDVAEAVETAGAILGLSATQIRSFTMAMRFPVPAGRT